MFTAFTVMAVFEVFTVMAVFPVSTVFTVIVSSDTGVFSDGSVSSHTSV